MTTTPQKGDRFTFMNGRTISGADIRGVTVVWCDGVDVHYRIDGQTEIKQTPIERFLAIAKPAK